jgi:hypothetical protein
MLKTYTVYRGHNKHKTDNKTMAVLKEEVEELNGEGVKIKDLFPMCYQCHFETIGELVFCGEKDLLNDVFEID